MTVAPVEQAMIREFSNQSANIDPGTLTQVLSEVIQPFMGKVSIMVGGLFGLYMIFIITRLHYERKKVILMKKILYNLDQMNMHEGIKCSRTKKTFIKKMFEKIKKLFR